MGNRRGSLERDKEVRREVGGGCFGGSQRGREEAGGESRRAVLCGLALSVANSERGCVMDVRPEPSE